MKAEYFDGGGEAIAKLAWKTPVSKAFEYNLIGKSAFPDGLTVEYFNNMDLSGMPNTDTEESIFFDPKNQPSDPLIPRGKMSIRWTEIWLLRKRDVIRSHLRLTMDADYILTVKS